MTGTVVDETGGVLPGVTVEVQAGAVERTAVTDDTGIWRVEGVPAGPASLTFRLVNFSTLRRDLEVAAGENSADAVLTLGLTADVVVTGSRTFRNIADLENPRENLVGVATSASVGAITAEQLAARPIMRPGEVLEAVPGFITSQHSGEGKANQYYLRGFNLDHGSDFATTLAGVPMNESSGAHAHGYSDVNLLIPELVSGVQYTKGPYFAEHGDFSAAGSANISYVNLLDRPLLSVSSGGQGWGRVFGAVSPEVGAGNLLLALETSTNDGPWELPDDMRKVNAVVRYSQGDLTNGFSITGMGYNADWNATDQIPLRAVESGSLSRFGAIDNTDAGRTSRYSVAFDGLRSDGTGSTRVTGYALQGGLNLFQNFTYFLEDPIDGDQIEQEGRRWVSGARLVHRRPGSAFDRPLESAVGASVRYDAVGTVGLYNTVARRRTNTIRNDKVDQSTVGLFGQTEIEWTRTFRTTLGVRGDFYRYNVDAVRALNTGSGTSALVSPKLTAVLGPWQGTELYLNYGQGFHSNDPRAATTVVDPITGERVASEDPLVPARGAEIGLRTVALPGLQSTVALWYLAFDSELIFVGDAGIAEASRPSRRLGVEWTNYVRLANWLTGELDVSLSRARFSDFDPAGAFIPGALDRVVAGAITVTPARRVFGSVRLRHFGPRPLIEDNSVQSASTTIWNGEIGVRINERLDIVLEAFNLLDSDVSDIDYFYTSRLPGEPADGVDDIHFHPSIPRTARVMLNVDF
ncbi:MAG: TonB-dependent receptor [Acidobacteria bacterium]|nr:TonB-dependent receptor [Acidobacteriota bacterium]